MSAEFNLDNILLDTFFSNDIDRQRVIIEVGAAGPSFLSFSQTFRTKNWQVISVEPNPIFCDAHRANGFDIHQFACSDNDIDNVDFTVVNSNNANYLDGTVSFESWSSLGMNAQFENHYHAHSNGKSINTIKVDVRKLDTILTTYHPTINKIDAISIDVEGWEVSVMKGFDTIRYQPDVVVLENFFNYDEYRNYMNSIGYSLWNTFTHNEVYVRNNAVLV